MTIPIIRSIWLAVAFTQLGGVGWVSAQTLLISQLGTGTVTQSSDVDSLQKQALEEGEAGKTDVAIRDYQRALERHPDWKEGLWNLGHVAIQQRPVCGSKG
jgi:hypothetical protein